MHYCNKPSRHCRPVGLFAVTFRDYVSKTLEGNDRYILVRRDEQRILTCFLEYGPDRVMVHDILTQREGAQWVQRASSYPKLRLAPGRIISKLGDLGITARQETAPSGMVRIVARNAVRPDLTCHSAPTPWNYSK